MVAKKTHPGKAQGDTGQGGSDAVPGSPPEAALGVWLSWLKNHLGALPGQETAAQILPSWLMPAEAVTGDALTVRLDQLRELVAKDPVLSSIDRAWNANPLHEVIPVDWAEVVRALRTVWLRRLADPGRVLTAMTDMNLQMVKSAVDAWNDAATRWWGLASATAQPGLGTHDKRFDAPEWHANPVYRTLKDLYLLASDLLLKESEAEDLEPAERERLRFHLEQFVNATSPTLLLFSNPAALRRAMETGGASIADGARNLLHDLKEGRLTMVDAKAFAPGRNLAVTPGKVVYRNRLIELIQYTPQTEQVYQTPLLFIPPWINKYYILDMQPKNSFVRYLVEQGFSVFVISWKNPDASMEEITFEDYMREGPLAAADVAKEITGSPTVNPVGYCIGGTLLVLALAYLAARGQRKDPFGTATFLVSLQDFAQVGESSLFMGESSIDVIEQQMMERGYLDSREMSAMFSLLRSNDLIWANVVNNYLMGNPPPAFDLLYWNSDGTRMARAAHSWYLRNTYVENNLIKPGHVTIMGEPIDLGRIDQDIYAVGAEKDHIVPWYAAWRITQQTGGRVRFVLASSGHIAGVINHPGPKKGANAYPVGSAANNIW
jgi:polyhydroxyalkanoate synthase subunit PhaC